VSRAQAIYAEVLLVPPDQLPDLRALVEAGVRHLRANGVTLSESARVLVDTIGDAAAVAIKAGGFRSSGFGTRPEAVSRMIGTTEAARRLGITDRRVRVLAEAGRIPAQRVAGRWQFDERDIEEARDDRRSA